MYIGGVAKVDGSASTSASAGATYTWAMPSTPPGSGAAPALTGANTAIVSFTPDRVGVYTLQLVVTLGGKSAQTTATVTVVDPPVFYYESAQDPDSGAFAAKLLVAGGTAGDGGKPVACFERDAGGSYDLFVVHTATGGTDWWEAPAGQPSRAAFVMQEPHDGGSADTLYATTSTATCATSPTKLDFVPPPAGIQHAFEQPRISPDGQRVAYVRQAPEGAQVATVGLDAANRRVLGSRVVDNDGGPLPEAGLDGFPRSRPFWIGNTAVGWVEDIAPDAWQVARANDVANATREVIARCSGAAPMQAAMLANGELLVAQPTGSAGMQLIVYPIVAATKSCGIGRVLTPVPDSGTTSAGDFVVSPDGKQVAYQSFEDAVTETRVVNIDGASAPRKVAAFKGAQRGPRYIASGAFVSFGNDGPALDAGWEGGVIAVVPADGGDAGVAANGPAIQSIGNGIFQSCSFTNGAGSGVAFAGIAGLALLRVARRRRRRD
jgi:hypothetical protein